jgi:hypothetical protein
MCSIDNIVMNMENSLLFRKDSELKGRMYSSSVRRKNTIMLKNEE